MTTAVATKSEESRYVVGKDIDSVTHKFLPGNRGGSPPGKHFATILRGALKEIDKKTGTRNDFAVVEAWLAQAKRGNTKAIEMALDRTDGKVEQKQVLTGPDGGPIQVQSVILSIEQAVNPSSTVLPQAEAEKSV